MFASNDRGEPAVRFRQCDRLLYEVKLLLVAHALETPQIFSR